MTVIFNLAALFSERAGKVRNEVSEINDDYLAMLKGAGNEELETKLDIYAKLAVEYAESPYLQLYQAAALWLGDIDEKELETIKTIAGELDL
jgi:hypothetical protein